MLESFVSLLAIGTILLAAYGVGRPMLRALGRIEMDRLTAVVWSLAMGLIAWGMALALLGAVGSLYSSLIVVASLVAGLWGVRELVRRPVLRVGSRSAETIDSAWDIDEPSRVAPPSAWLGHGAWWLAAVACSGALLGALAPPTAADSLCYHLELPKRFLADHALSFSPNGHPTADLLLIEMWYLWALALDGPVAAQLISWTLGVLLALATVVLARPLVGRDWAWAAGAVVVLVPGVNRQMTMAGGDIGLTLLTTLVLAAWWRAMVSQEGRRWFILAGVAAGAALSAKYSAMWFVAAVALVWAWTLARHPSRRRVLLEGAAIVSLVAVVTSGFWYARAAWRHGEPIYPALVGTAFDALSEPDSPETSSAGESSPSRGLLGLVVAPWRVTIEPERFGDREYPLGVLFLGVMPGLCLARRLRGLGSLLGVAAVYGVVWYFVYPRTGLLLPIVAPLAVAVVWVWIEVQRFPPRARWAATAVVALVLGVSALAAVGQSRDCWAVAFGGETRQAFLSRCEPSFGAAVTAHTVLGPEARILSQDTRLFYFDAKITREDIFRRKTQYDRQIEAPSDFSRVLRVSGFTHVLLVENLAERGAAFDSRFSRLAEADDSLELVSEHYAEDAEGGWRHYRLLALP